MVFQPRPLGPSGNWKLLFHDEFEGTTLDTTKWRTNYPHGCWHSYNQHNELQCYQASNIVVSHRMASIQGRPEKAYCSDGRTYHYTSGLLCSAGTFEHTYFFAEMRAKLPKGQGIWPAFWLWASNEQRPREIDVLEVLGHDPTTVHMTYHWGSWEKEEQDGSHYNGQDVSADFHTYGVDWSPEAIVWYIDGIERKRFSEAANIADEPLYLLANLAIGGDWPGDPDEKVVWPVQMQIDYIRVWEKDP